MESDFSYLRDHYPQEVTSDQVRQISDSPQWLQTAEAS